MRCATLRNAGFSSCWMMTSVRGKKQRLSYAIACLIIIVLGLLWRSAWLDVSRFWSKYGGDALWAMMIYCGLGIIRPSWPTRYLAVLAALICSGVELSQLYHAPWIDTLRSYKLGALVLGSKFNWPDFPAYYIGILLIAGMRNFGKSSLSARSDKSYNSGCN